tara:strand:- start:34461 stop:35381 length:921 start_codon:yes stop_codon:yes gene_type:complete
MRKTGITGIILVIVLVACKNKETSKRDYVERNTFLEIEDDSYQLVRPKENPKEVLILFGGYPENAEDIKREFDIVDNVKKRKVSVIFMNYSQKIWLTDNELEELAEEVQDICKQNNLPMENVFIGGFSSGGNVALLLSEFLIKNQRKLTPKGVFAVDSPIDLVALYKSSEKNVARNFSEVSVNESSWLMQTLENRFGNPYDSISNYEEFAVFTSETNNYQNLKNLKKTPIRFYTEPDTLWWKKNRMADFDQTNAFYLQKLSEILKRSGYSIEYIATTNKGYRANGVRHPHSWAIVDKEELLDWIQK